jgi:HEAT repeat protein
MTSDRLHSRIAALKYILRNKIDIAGFPDYQNMMESRHIPERYWLAKALGGSRTPETREYLHRLLDDPHFNVVCMALDSLGRRGNRADVPRILGKIETSHNWYEQWYAYRALRRLGWQQKESNEERHM